MNGPTPPTGSPDPECNELLLALDRLLFIPDRWFAIDEANRCAAGVVVSSLEQGLRLAWASQDPSAGRRVTIAGRLRPEVVAVDVDAAGVIGDAVVEDLAGWCRARDLWHLVRPSGGGPGRAHVLIVAGSAVDELETYTAALRRQYRIAGPGVDLRGGRRGNKALRPLSAPHRSGPHLRPLGPLRQLQRTLRAAVGAPPPPQGPQRRRATRSAALVHRPGPQPFAFPPAAMAPLPRAVRPLPDGWAAHLQRGAPAPVQAGDRSGLELLATGVLMRTGHDVAKSWAAIASSPDGVMSKAKTRGRGWWERNVWNAVVRTDADYRTSASDRPSAPRPAAAAPHPPEPTDAPEVLQAVYAGRDALGSLQWRVAPRARPAVLLVAHTLLDRMERVHALTVPCPLRDLQLDTGLSLRTASAALDTLDGLLGRRVRDTFDPTRRDSTSHTFALDPRFLALVEGTSEILARVDSGVSHSATPVSHTPHRPAPPPPGTWAYLGPGCHQLWRVLPRAHQPRLMMDDLARSAGMSSGPHASLSRRQIRTVRGYLTQLQGAGMALVDAQGCWHGTDVVVRSCRGAAQALHQVTMARVTAERQAYREGAGRAGSAWRAGRAAALVRQRRRDVVRQRRWWGQLSPAERAARMDRFAAQFDSLPPVAQATMKNDWAARRAASGQPTERSRHERWVSALSDPEYTRRSVLRAARFAQLPRPLQVAFVQEWHQHRRAWDIAQGPGVATPAGLDAWDATASQTARDQAHLRDERQMTLPYDEATGS